MAGYWTTGLSIYYQETGATRCLEQGPVALYDSLK